MGSVFWKRDSAKIANRVQVINETENKKQYKYLEPRGKIQCLWDLVYNVLVLDIEF